MIPQGTINALRKAADVSVENFGIECTLYILNNPLVVEDLDIYAAPSDSSFTVYTVQVWIEWAPTMRRLRGLGLHEEENLPILARFKSTAASDDSNGVIVSVDPTIGSYIEAPTQYVPDKFASIDKFEIVDILVGNMHDAVITKLYRLAPRRVYQEES